MATGTLVLFVGGGAALIVGAELLVRGASRLAVAVGMPPLVIGLTVVAFGTSAPELAVTVGSAFAGEADVALGNVVGSNIFNLLFILGVSALIRPLVVAHQLIRIDVPLLVGTSALVAVLAVDGRVGRVDGAVLTAGVFVYTVVLIRHGRRSATTEADREVAPGPVTRATRRCTGVVGTLAVIAAGLVLLVIGARWLVDAAVSFATAAGVSELVVGLTIVAAGTSLPEVATSVLATFRGQRDIAVGNVVGSCLFNLLAVLGIGSLIAPEGVPIADGALRFDLPVMVAVSVAALPIFFTGHTIARWEGAVFLGYYAAYAGYLVLAATDHHLTGEVATAVLWFALPLTALTFVVSTVRAVRAGRSP